MLAGAVALVVAGGVVGGIAASQAAVTPSAAVAGGAPYIFPADNGSVNPVSVMQKTGVRAFTLAFILNRGNCSPVWNESSSLNNGAITSRINAIRKAGGDVVISFGGFSGSKLGNACRTETALAGAYQKVINTYRLKTIDIDLEAGEVSQSVKVLKALKIVKQKNPGIQVILTLGTGTGGLVGDEAPIPRRRPRWARRSTCGPSCRSTSATTTQRLTTARPASPRAKGCTGSSSRRSSSAMRGSTPCRASRR